MLREESKDLPLGCSKSSIERSDRPPQELVQECEDEIGESNEGKIDFEIEKMPNRMTINTKFKARIKQIVIPITNNGMGILEEIKKCIFEQVLQYKESEK